MYNVRGPSKIVAKTTRRGISQNMEFTRNKSVENEDSSSVVSKPIFHKRVVHQHHRHEAISPQHEEIIRFVNDSWNKVCADINSANKTTQSVYYEEEPNHLEGFKPFDLESWWGKRLYACITGSNNSKN